VPGDLCETVVPSLRSLADGHEVKCHLTDAQLANMEPVIEINVAAE